MHILITLNRNLWPKIILQFYINISKILLKNKSPLRKICPKATAKALDYNVEEVLFNVKKSVRSAVLIINRTLTLLVPLLDFHNLW